MWDPDPELAHDDACMCRVCVEADFQAAIRANGLDPGRFPVERNIGGRYRVEWPQLPPAWTDDDGDEDDGYEDDEFPQPESVPVPVYCLHAGAWARFTGVDHAGRPVTVSGAVVAGPDETTVSGPPGWVVLVRDYRGNPDVAVYVPEDGTADLVDDESDHEARAAQALDPVFGDPQRAALVRPMPGWEPGDWLPLEDHDQVTAEQLDQWTEPGSGVLLVSVHRAHLPMPGGAR
jgi:hypothetical protein